MRPVLFVALLLAALLAAGTLEHRTPALTPPAHAADTERCPGARRAVRFYRDATWRWQTQRDTPPTRYAGSARSPSCPYVQWAARMWANRSWNARTRYEHWYARVYEKWRCVHEREGAWTDDHAPHWGGLQMDMPFQATYGGEFLRRWGTANHWPVYAQLIAAERAFHGYGGHGARYWEPWPNTARACGLR